MKDPNYKTKEILMSLTTQTHLNEFNSMGLSRITEYEAVAYNTLYMQATLMSYQSLKLLVFKSIGDAIIANKMNSMIIGEDPYIEEFDNLVPALKLYYLTYYYFKVYKERTFVDELLNQVNILLSNGANSEQEVLYTFNLLIHDLSYNKSTNSFLLLAWERVEIKKVFNKLISLINKLEINPNARPMRGVLALSISNWVLKSRNYNDSYIFKSVGDMAANSSLENNEIWMSDIKSLNDKMEQKAITTIYTNKCWIKHKWAKKVNLESNINCYVSSYTKVKPSEKMKKEYGANVYGYKNDRIADILSPIYLREKIPFFNHVSSFEIIYDKKALRKELNYVADIVDMFNIKDNEKTVLFNRLLQYWLLSYKNKKWKHEQERRFQLLIFPKDYTYIDMRIENSFLKLSSSVLSYPDFILGNINSEQIKKNRLEKVGALASREYMFCEDCFQSNYDDLFSDENTVCDICGSKNYKKVKK
jgi:hypothetical protein